MHSDGIKSKHPCKNRLRRCRERGACRLSTPRTACGPQEKQHMLCYPAHSVSGSSSAAAPHSAGPLNIAGLGNDCPMGKVNLLGIFHDTATAECSKTSWTKDARNGPHGALPFQHGCKCHRKTCKDAVSLPSNFQGTTSAVQLPSIACNLHGCLTVLLQSTASAQQHAPKSPAHRQ
jgi:hypothetical protein